MKVDETAHEANSTALLSAAARLLRRDGAAGLHVAEVARAAGLTHGAVYARFRGKVALTEAACQAACADAVARWRRRVARAAGRGANPVAALIDAYLTEAHRDSAEDGCVVASAGAELARHSPEVRAALAAGTGALVDVLAETIAAYRGLPADAARKAALAAFAAMSGGLLLARALAERPEASRAALAEAARLARRAADPPS
jgi:TetR/AcrR family transcriptional repressor of nem operon